MLLINAFIIIFSYYNKHVKILETRVIYFIYFLSKKKTFRALRTGHENHVLHTKLCIFHNKI